VVLGLGILPLHLVVDTNERQSHHRRVDEAIRTRVVPKGLMIRGGSRVV